jgi:hypothetical protein
MWSENVCFLRFGVESFKIICQNDVVIRDRLVVGHQVLVLATMVRIHVPEPRLN